MEGGNNYFANYTDDTTLSFPQKQSAEVFKNPSCLTKKLFSWFSTNQMKASNDKCHLRLCSPEKDPAIQVEESTI